jgi:hypothetical protein
MDAVNHKRSILTYPIASGEMYYAVANERAVYLQGDPEAGFSLYGQILNGGDASSANLAEVLLEFAMTWSTPGDPSEARRQMQIFGKHLGEALADQRARAKPVNGALGCAAGALEDVLRSLKAPFGVQHTKSKVRYELDRCPLCVTAEVTGTDREAELARHALHALYRSLVNAIDPGLQIKVSGEPNAKHAISVVAPTSK